MNDEMNYCDRCGKLVPPADAKSGKASVGDDGSLCAACVSAGPDAGKGGMTGTTKIIIGSVGGGVLLAILVLAFMGGGRSEITPPPPPPKEEPKVAVVKAPPAVVEAPAPAPTPAVQVDARAQAVRQRLDNLLEMIDPALTRYAEVRRGLLRLHGDATGTDALEEILTMMAEIDRQYAALANAALEDAKARASQIANAGDRTAAVQVLREVGRRFGEGPWLTSTGSREIATAVAAIERLAATPASVQTPAGRSVVIQYTGQDRYTNDRIPGTNTPGPVRDTWLRSDTPDNEGFRNYHEFWVSTEYSADRRNGYGLIRFELPETQADAVVSARLHVYGWNDSPPGGLPVSVYPLLKAWNQASNGASYNNRERDVPWNPGKTPSSFNANPATTNDFNSGMKVHLADAKRGQWNTWDITPFVKAWLSGSLPNHGVVLLGDRPDSVIRCYSSNYFDDDLPDKGVSLRPKLEIVLK